MGKYKLIPILVLIFLFLCFSSAAYTEEELVHVPGAIQICSTVSDGKLSIPEIVKIARENNIKIVIFTDRDFMRWEYGLWPLRNVIKRTVESNSVFNYGIGRYLKEIEDAQKENPDMVLIPGVESAPFYYWEDNPLKGNLKIYNWHKHMLVIGLGKVNDYKNLPNISNRYSLALPFTFKNIYFLWPILILSLGILFFRKRKFRYRDIQGRPLGPYSRGRQIFGIILVILGILFLYNNFPFCDFRYDQYHGDQGISPYQNLIDYVNKKGGLTFWTHPEAEYIEKRGMVSIETMEYSNDLLETYNYNGFAILYEGYKKVGCPGGIWDELLKQYCQGERKSPVWAIAGLSFEEGDLGRLMKDLKTVFIIPHCSVYPARVDLDKTETLKALKEGKMYIVRGIGDLDLILDEFSVKDNISDARGTIADEIALKGEPIIRINGHFTHEEVESVKVKLIRSGIVIKMFEVKNPFNIEYQDDYFSSDEKIYYRIEIKCLNKLIITNPIFVKFKR